jgi:ribosomal protein S4
MIHPGYMLNPGDMFSVDIDTVLWATGRRKLKGDAKAISEETSENDAEANELNQDDQAALAESAEAEDLETSIEEDPNDPAAIKERKASLKSAREMIDNVIEKDNPSATRKRELRQLRKQINVLVQHVKSDDSESKVANFQNNLNAVLTKVELSKNNLESEQSSEDTSTSIISTSLSRKSSSISRNDHIAALAQSYSQILNNKAYEQPWVPRDWMAPFAYVPRYLEVNYTICSAVYLRHPVARPGMAEVPTPFSIETGSLAHNWYLRRR